MMEFEIVAAHELSFADQATVFNDAFSGYVGGSFELDAGRLAGFIAIQGIDLCYSRFARDGAGQIASFGYINRTANVSRLAGMGTIAAARRSGAAAFLLRYLTDEARKRGDAAMVLEVIEQNPAAVALYQAHGFCSLGRLYGWRTANENPSGDENALQEISLFDALKLPGNVDYPELPWAICRHAIVKPPLTRVFAIQNVAIVVGDPAATPIRIYAYLGPEQDWQAACIVTAAVLTRFRGREFFAPPVFPETFGEQIFAPLKFGRESLNQFLMRKDL